MARGRHAPPALAAGLLVLTLLLGRSALLSPPVHADGHYAVVRLPVQSATARANGQLEDFVLIWLNRTRAAEHLAPLSANAKIQSVARAYGLDMFAHGYLSHVSRDGRSLRDRLTSTGLLLRVVGENLAYAPAIQEAEQALWQSAPHRRNILYPAFRLVGIGVIDGGDEGVIVVQDFSDDPAADAAAGRLPVAPSLMQSAVR